MSLITTKAPQLPQAPEEYTRDERNRYSNVLRLYFNQIDNIFGPLLGNQGGKYLRFPYAAIQRTTDKTFTANTATQITFDQNDFLNGCTNDGTDGIHVEQSGIYNYQFSVQFANTTNNVIHTAWIWLKKNGEDIEGTGSKFDVPGHHSTSDGYLIAACNFYVSLEAGDTVEMWAAVDDTAVYMEAYAAQTSPFAMPSIPSVVATLSFVSAPLT
jgi:hypothetical protein